MSERTAIDLDWTHHEFLQLGEIQTVCPCTQKPTFTLSTQNVALFLGIPNAAQIFDVSLRPVSAPMSSSRGILMAFNGANLDFAATTHVLTIPSSYSWRTYDAAA